MAAPTNNPIRKRVRKGKPAGSRHNITQSKDGARGSSNKDPRLGSKKKVSLIDPTAASDVKTPKKTFKTPAQELNFIESDERLQNLLDIQEEGVILDAEDQSYVDERLGRHKILCDLLGIGDDDEDADENDQ
jgi:ribosome assembly protein YihI (activator of Der GTPase)